MPAESPEVLAFRPPTRRRLHEVVAEQLRDAILDGRFPAGDRLPPERELAAEFQVNRSSIREAIGTLAGLGLVRVRQGDGAIVQPLADASFELLPAMVLHGGRIDHRMLAEVGEFVQPLLRQMAKLAIERREPGDLEGLRALLDRAALAGAAPEERAEALRDLMIALSDMTGNRAWQMLARRLRGFFEAEPLREARARLQSDPARLLPSIDRCLAALERSREDEAIAALDEVIRNFGEPLLGGRAAGNEARTSVPRGAAQRAGAAQRSPRNGMETRKR